MNQFLKEFLAKIDKSICQEEVKEISKVSGGCIHEAWLVQLDNGKKLFAKTSSLEKFEMLQFEAYGLQTLRGFTDSSLLKIPKPIAIGTIQTKSVLILPWLDLQSGDQKSLGAGLALTHKTSSLKNLGSFGCSQTGFIGLSPQIKGFEENWGKCFVRLRLLPQLQFATNWGLKVEDWELFLKALIEFLNDHNPVPTLVHGDLWSGNSGTTTDGRGVIFDPAIWWADREVDIAMTYLFGGFSNEFYKSYEDIWPLPPSAKERVEIYNLYHLLNHANLFGGSYQYQSIESLNRLKELILK